MSLAILSAAAKGVTNAISQTVSKVTNFASLELPSAVSKAAGLTLPKVSEAARTALQGTAISPISTSNEILMSVGQSAKAGASQGIQVNPGMPGGSTIVNS